MRLHITEQPPMKVPDQWVLEYPMEKRVSAMCEFVEYIFRDYGIALLTYREYAVIILKNVMNDLRSIRTDLQSKGATEQQLKPLDDAVCDNFIRVCDIVKNRNDIEVLNSIQDYDIQNYHLECHT